MQAPRENERGSRDEEQGMDEEEGVRLDLLSANRV
jgi:hypothetical protein